MQGAYGVDSVERVARLGVGILEAQCLVALGLSRLSVFCISKALSL